MNGFLRSDNIELAGLDLTPAVGSIFDQPRGAPLGFAGCDIVRTKSTSNPKPAPAAPLWWKVTMRLHGDQLVIRDVAGTRPKLSAIRANGWTDVRPNGDELFVHPDALAVIIIESGFGTPPPSSGCAVIGRKS